MTVEEGKTTMSAESLLKVFLEQKGIDLDKLQLPSIAAFAFQDDGLSALNSLSKASPIGDWDFPGTSDSLFMGNYKGEKVLIGKIPEGAPKAVVFLEFIRCVGINRIIVTGAAGSLQAYVHGCSLVATTTAIREEGTSYFYLDASEIAHASEELLHNLLKAANRYDIQVHSGPTLTGDAPFRLSQTKIKHYQSLGVLTAEMELSALFVAAQFWRIDLAGLLVISDTHIGEKKIFAFEEEYQHAQEQAAKIILEALHDAVA